MRQFIEISKNLLRKIPTACQYINPDINSGIRLPEPYSISSDTTKAFVIPVTRSLSLTRGSISKMYLRPQENLLF